MNASIGGRLDPWVEVIPGESAAVLQARVQQHGKNYLTFWLDKLSAPGAETSLEFLDTSTPHQTTARVHSMMGALAAYLGPRSPKNRLTELHMPISVQAVDGHEVVTSPVLIATTAVVYSQTDWNRRRFHDLRSASRTQGLLEGLSYPPELIRLVALLVGLKNVVRTSIIEDKEVGVWDGKQLSFDDEEIPKCFAVLLQDLCPANIAFPVSPEAMADALVLVTAAYEARSKPPTSALLGEFEGFGTRLKNALRSSTSKCGTLVAVEFSKFPFKDFRPERVRFIETVAKMYLGSIEGPAPFMIWFSLDRYWSTMHPDALLALSSTIAARFQPWEDSPSRQRPGCFTGLLEPDSTILRRLVLEGDDAFEVIIGQRPPPGATIWERVDITLSNFRARRGNNSRIPTAYLARQLQILYFCYPAEMFELRVQGDERIKGLSAYTSLWLPRQDLPSVEDLENLAKTSKGLTDPKLLVARYAASMVLNRSIGFGWPARVFESVEAGTPTEQWIKLIQWVAVRNAHEEWFKYLGKYRAAPPDQPYPVPQRVCVAKAADSIADSLVLGVDIGGMGTKIALYGYDPKSRTLSRPLCEHRFETKRPGGQQYENAEAFAKRLDEELARAWLEWPSYRDRLVAIGVTWPGAVAGRPGLEYVAANSGALAYFMPFPPTKHWEAEAAAIRRLCLREAFEKHFERGGWCPYVRLINDGVAHVLFEHWQLKQFAPRSGEIVVGHTAGMGAGMAVLDAHTGNPLDVLAELGRLITHISDPFPPPEAPPAGQGRDAFNTLTLGAVATKLLKQKLVEPGTASHFITGKLSSNPEIVSQILALALGDSTSTPTPWSLPQVPSLLVGWLIEEKHATRPDAKTAPYFEGLWNPKKTSSVPSLLDLRKSLHDFLKDIGCSDWPDEQAFATDVVKRAGYELADLIATTVGLFGATNVITGGGPLSDYVGKELRDAARDALRDDYKFEVVENALMSGVKGHHLARLIRFPEPYDSTIPLPRPTGPSAPFGAASAVIELLPRL